MAHTNGNDPATQKTMRILFPILYLILLACATAAFVNANWIGLMAILAGMLLLGLGRKAKARTVGAYYDPDEEYGKYKAREEVEHHPEDVPLNPWDQVSGEQAEDK